MMKKILFLVLIILVVFSTTACVSSIKDIKKESNVGKKVIVKGKVGSSIKLGSLSGFTIEDDSDSIFVSTNDLAEEGSNKIIRGTLEKNILGYYIEKK